MTTIKAGPDVLPPAAIQQAPHPAQSGLPTVPEIPPNTPSSSSCARTYLDLLNAYARPTSSVITNAKIRDTLSRLPSHVSTFVMWRQSAARTPHQWRSYEDARLQEGLGIIEDLKSCASYGRRNLQAMWHALWNTGLTSFVQEVVVSRYPRWSQAYVVPMSELSPIALGCLGRLRPLDSGLREAAVLDDETFAQCLDDWRGYRI